MISIIIPSLPDSQELNTNVIDSINETKSSEVEVILEVSQRTFAENVNRGIKRSSGNILLVLNNDVTMLPGWQDWVERAAMKGIAALSPSSQMGWGFAMSREIFERIGFFDENLVNSYDDYDFFIRAAFNEIPRILARRNFAIHQGGQSLKRIWGEFREQSKQRLSQCNANREVIVKKWPGLQVDGVPTLYFVHHGIAILREWKKQHASV